MTSHKTSALSSLSKGDEMAAQVHATLYLAEQQRIANLLTCWKMYGKERTFGAPQTDDDLPHEIREGLGLL